MNIANANILICPFCGAEKPVIQLLSGNTFGATQWSDLKTNYPMLQQPSPVQQCPQCGKFYFTGAVKKQRGPDYSFEKGDLNYEQIKQALSQYEHTSLPPEEEVLLRLLFLHIYNDTFQREGVTPAGQPAEQDVSLFRKQVLRLLQIWKAETLVKAELYREIGEMNECIRLLDSLQADEPFKYKIAEQIRRLALQGVTSAFVIYGNRGDF